MLPIKELLGRFKNIANSEKVKKQIILEIFVNNNIPIQLKQITINKNNLFIKVQPIIKTEILLKKEQLINKINEHECFSNIKNII